jgi:hypothetical protein
MLLFFLFLTLAVMAERSSKPGPIGVMSIYYMAFLISASS